MFIPLGTKGAVRDAWRSSIKNGLYELLLGAGLDHRAAADLSRTLEDNGTNYIASLQEALDRNNTCSCGSTRHEVINRNLMWGDGDVICRDCKKFVRYYDAG